jgi:hypothetical protein
VRQIAQPRGAIDRWADVVSLVAQPHLTGVHPDTQPDRRQRCPLQIQRAGRRIGGAGERDHKAIALALFDRADSVMGGDRLGHRPVEAGHGGGHLLGLALPQPRRTLDVGQQQRHRARRQSPLTPSSLQSTSGASTRGSISLMLASMRRQQVAKHQRNRADYSPSHAYLRPLIAQIYALRPMVLASRRRIVESIPNGSKPPDRWNQGSSRAISPNDPPRQGGTQNGHCDWSLHPDLVYPDLTGDQVTQNLDATRPC